MAGKMKKADRERQRERENWGVGGELAREEGVSEGWSEGNREDKGRVNSLWK